VSLCSEVLFLTFRFCKWRVVLQRDDDGQHVELQAQTERGKARIMPFLDVTPYGIGDHYCQCSSGICCLCTLKDADISYEGMVAFNIYKRKKRFC